MDSAKSEYEILREQNKRERDALFASMFKDIDEFTDEFVGEVKKLKNSNPKNSPKRNKKMRNSKDSSVRFNTNTPEEIRKSARLKNIKPQYTFDEIENFRETVTSVHELKLFHDEVPSIGDLKSKFSYKKKQAFNGQYKTLVPSYNLVYLNNPKFQLTSQSRNLKKITDKELKNIAEKSSEKVFSKDGTVCHQCRQQTLDTKSICRNQNCIGIRGQFCGPCLKNRYNESVATALKDPTWCCPSCRNICNCSICRHNTVEMQFAVLPPALRQISNNFLNVVDEQENIIKSFIEKDSFTEVIEDENLIGFSLKRKRRIN